MLTTTATPLGVEVSMVIPLTIGEIEKDFVPKPLVAVNVSVRPPAVVPK